MVEGKREEEREREKESKRGRERESSANEKKKKKKLDFDRRRRSSLFHNFPPFFPQRLFLFRFYLIMAVGKNKRVSKRGKGGRKKAYVVPRE